MKDYHKIPTVFIRDNKTKKMLVGEYANETIESLKDVNWQFTEKIDGTNIRVHWDGHKVTLGGRTDDSQVPSTILNRLMDLFMGEENAQLFEQKFGEMPVTLFGEGYGKGIQSKARFSNEQDFILFDVLVNESLYLRRPDVEDVANYFGIKHVPVIFEGTLEQGIEHMLNGSRKSFIGGEEVPLEGYVARPKIEVLDRLGKRVVVKMKIKDFE